MNRKQQQPTTTHSCQSACSVPSPISSTSTPPSFSSSSTPSIISSFLPPSSRASLYGSEFDPFYSAMNTTTSPIEPSSYPRSIGGGARGLSSSSRAFDLSRSLCSEVFGAAKDPLMVDVFGFESINPTVSTSSTTSMSSSTTTVNGTRHRQLMMRDHQSLEEEDEAVGLQRLDGASECRQRDTRMTAEGVYGGRQQTDPEDTSGQAISAIQMWSTNWGSASTPYSNSIACASDRYFRRRHHLHHHHLHHHHRNHYHQAQQQPHPMAAAALVADGGGVRECASCGASLSKTVLRRRNSFGHYICNSCESQLKINESIRTTTTKKTTQTKKSSRRSGLLCANCNSSASTLWRRNNEGETVCNACGLYYKLHGINRPITMRKDGIQTRKRRPKGSKHLLNGGQSSLSSSPDQELTTKTTILLHGSSVTSDKCSNPRMASSKSCSPRRDDIGASKREPLSPIHASPPTKDRIPTTFGHLADSNYNGSYGSMLYPCAVPSSCSPVVSQPEHDLRRSHLFAFYDTQDIAKTTTLTNLEVPPKCYQSVPYAHPYISRNVLHHEHEKQLSCGGAPLQHHAGPLYGVTSVPTAVPVQGEPRSFNSYYNFSNYNCYNFSNFNSCSAAVYQM